MLKKTLLLFTLMGITAFLVFQKRCAPTAQNTPTDTISTFQDSTLGPTMDQGGASSTVLSHSQDSALKIDVGDKKGQVDDHTASLLSSEESAKLSHVMAAASESKEPDVPMRTYEIDFEQIHARSESQGESIFSGSYTRIMENVSVGSKPERHQVRFVKGIKNVISVVVVGESGEVEIQDLKFNNRSSETQKVTLYEQDWMKSEDSFANLESLELIAQSVRTGSFNVYIQVMGEK